MIQEDQVASYLYKNEQRNGKLSYSRLAKEHCS